MVKKRNLEIAKIFYEIADIYELKKTRWKPQAYRLAAQTLESLRHDVKEIYEKDGAKAIDELPGIGSAFTKKIIEYIKTGKIKRHEQLKKGLPGELYKMMKVPGIGPKKAALFYNKLKIRNVKELKKAAKQHKLQQLPGFKKRSEEKVIEGIQLKKAGKGRIPLKEAQIIGKSILSKVKKIPNIKRVKLAGSLRRKKPTVGDIDIVAETTKPKEVLTKFTKISFVKRVLGKGKAKAIVITKDNIQAELRTFSNKQYGAGLLYYTGDKQHNIWLRKIAIKKGLKLNEYGLFEKKTNKQIAGKTEAEIYKKLNQKLIKPENRIGEGR